MNELEKAEMRAIETLSEKEALVSTRHAGKTFLFAFLKKRSTFLILLSAGAIFFIVRSVSALHGIDIPRMFISFLMGLSFFLYGMTIMEKSLDRLAGNKMKNFLQHATKNRFAGAATGVVTTVLVGSSSIASVLLINLVGTNALSFARSIPVILGTNIGSTLTIQLLSFNIDAVVPYLIVAGFLIFFLNSDKKWNSIGSVIFGLALLFFGLMLMKNAMAPLRTFEPFQMLMIKMSNPFLGMLIGFVFAGLIQSSAATMGVVVALAMNGLLGVDAGIALALGAHSGKCVTILLASLAKIGKTLNAKRTTAALVAINVGSSFVFLFFIPQLVSAVQLFGGDSARQVANADTLFNVIATIILMPFTVVIATYIEKKITKSSRKESGIVESRYLRSEEEICGPLGVYFGLAGVKQEMHRMGMMVLEQYKGVLNAMLHGTEEELEEIMKKDKDVDILYDKIFENILYIRTVEKTPEQEKILMKLEHFADELERAGDTVKRLAHYGLERCEEEIEISTGTQSKIIEIHGLIHEQFARILGVISDVMTKEERAQTESDIIKEQTNILKREQEIIDYLGRIRTKNEPPFRMNAFKIERDMLRYMARFYKKISHMARLHLSRYDLAPTENQADS